MNTSAITDMTAGVNKIDPSQNQSNSSPNNNPTGKAPATQQNHTTTTASHSNAAPQPSHLGNTVNAQV